MFIVRRLSMAGAERQLALLAAALVARGHAVVVLTLYPGGELAEWLKGSGVTLLDVGKSSRWDLLHTLRESVRACRLHEPDVICGWMPFENLLALLLGTLFHRVPVIWTLRTSALNLRDYDFATRSIYRLQRLLIRAPALVLSNSIAGLSSLGLTTDSSRVGLLRNIVDSEYFAPSADSRRDIRQQWRVGDGAKLIGVVGRLDPIKDHGTFLRAVSLVLKVMPEARAVVVGGGDEEYAARLHREAESLGIAEFVIWTGFSSDVARILNGLDVLVSTSRYGEGMQNSLLEGMACGVPVVATDVGDARWIVSAADIVVPPTDARAVAEAVLHQLRGGAKDGRSQRLAFIAQFTAEKMCTEFIRKVEGLLASREMPAPQ